jgi:tetratricopeptide (TPR) repeat protein
LGITALVLGWLSSNKEGIVISAFEDTTGGKYGANIGKAIADSLVTELVRIREINQLIKVIKETLTSAKDLELPRDLEQRIEFTDVPKLFMLPILDSESSLGGIGITNSAIEVGSIKFTIEPVLLYLRQLWPFGGVSTIVTGSLQTYDSSDGVDTRLVALLNFKDKITSWEVTRPGFEKKIIPEMLKELAFKIAFLVVKSEQNFAPTWERLKDIVETINDYYKYLQNRDLESLHQGNKRCQKLINNERFKRKTGEGNRNFSKLIQDLHWVIGYSYLLEKRYLDAEEVFDLLSRKFNKSSYYNALANTLYSQKNSEKLKLAVEQYGRSIRISQDNISQDNEEKNKPDPYIGLGSVYAVLGEATEALRNYDEAYQCNKELWKSSYNLGKIYLYYLPDTFHPEENKLCHLSEIFGDNVPKKYEIASKIIEKCLHFQQNKGNFYLHSALGLAYLFQSVYSVTDNKKKKKYLNLAQTNAEKAAYLGGEVDFIFWNLGLTRLGSLMIENDQNKCKSIIEGAFSAWKIALIIDQKERRKLQQKDRERDEQLKVLIYENMIKIFSGKNLCSREINYLLQRKGLDEPYLRTRRKVLEKDLDVICEILKKNRFNH